MTSGDERKLDASFTRHLDKVSRFWLTGERRQPHTCAAFPPPPTVTKRTLFPTEVFLHSGTFVPPPSSSFWKTFSPAAYMPEE